jgi:hypothetical protein
MKMVAIEAKVPIQLIQKVQFFCRIMSHIAHSPSDDRVVLLLDKTVVVFSVAPGSGKGYFLLYAGSIDPWMHCCLIKTPCANICRTATESSLGRPSTFFSTI